MEQSIQPTPDIDAFFAASPGSPPGDVRPLASELIDALGTKGWDVAIVRDHVAFRRLIATRDSRSVEIDLAARKVLAIIDRAEGRDFTDLYVLQLRYGRDDCISWARQLDSGLITAAIAGAFKQLSRLDNNEPPTDDPNLIRASLANWGTELDNS